VVDAEIDMAMRIELTRDGYKTVWRNGPKGDGTIYVDVWHGDKHVMEWAYGKVVGNSVMGNASFWLDQAILQAKHEETKVA
jgi:hypothetical protein